MPAAKGKGLAALKAHAVGVPAADGPSAAASAFSRLSKATLLGKALKSFQPTAQATNRLGQIERRQVTAARAKDDAARANKVGDHLPWDTHLVAALRSTNPESVKR